MKEFFKRVKKYKWVIRIFSIIGIGIAIINFLNNSPEIKVRNTISRGSDVVVTIENIGNRSAHKVNVMYSNQCVAGNIKRFDYIPVHDPMEVPFHALNLYGTADNFTECYNNLKRENKSIIAKFDISYTWYPVQSFTFIDIDKILDTHYHVYDLDAWALK